MISQEPLSIILFYFIFFFGFSSVPAAGVNDVSPLFKFCFLFECQKWELFTIEAGRGVLPSDKMKSQRSNSVLKIGFSLSTQ